ncbi:MAG: hypothetical protein ACQEQL_09045 [Pseudomonadota bacterium]
MTPITTRRLQQQPTPDYSLAVADDTYALITDVLAGKIMTALEFKRPYAATETAAELFTLLEKGVSAKSINLQSLSPQIFDMYLSGQYNMAKIAEKYLIQLSKYDVSYAGMDFTRLQDTVNQIHREAPDPLAVLGADNLYQLLVLKYFQNKLTG